jgi:hypothetical protein
MPVWQRFYEIHQPQGTELLSVAMDVQGADRARPYVEAAGATFPTVVDEGNLLGQLYGFKAVPNGFLIDERGILKYRKLGSFDICRAETADILDRWTSGSDLAGLSEQADSSTGSTQFEADLLFRRGLDLYRKGSMEAAITLWRWGLDLDPGNYIIRKQIWAVQNPERFYNGEVDYSWQREQMSKDR